MDDVYEAVILVPVKIPASMVEPGGSHEGYDALEDEVLGKAALGLQEFIVAFRAEAARG